MCRQTLSPTVLANLFWNLTWCLPGTASVDRTNLVPMELKVDQAFGWNLPCLIQATG